MVKLSDIVKALINILKSEFPNIQVDGKDLSEEFNRPSFRVDIDDLRTEYIGKKHKFRNVTLRIYYYTTKEKATRLEILNVIDRMEKMLGISLAITPDFIIPINDIEFEDGNGGVLISSFNITSLEEIEINEEYELMEELEIELN